MRLPSRISAISGAAVEIVLTASKLIMVICIPVSRKTARK